MVQQHRTNYRQGFSILEIIGVVTILGVLIAIAVPSLSSQPAANLYAESVSAQLQQARFEAIKRNRPVVVVWDSTEQAFITRANQNNSSIDCNAASAGDTLRIHRTNEYGNGNLSVSFSGLADGIIWLPTGLSRDCDNGLSTGNITIAGRNASYQLVLSSAGRVRIQKL